eukprot:TRINITY_DN51506_c0_g3_i1.p1 TRINITY_DN51506_c0_g3~~TRINITY_DN51506_c0_g3_i1.p1  ORF type:complete len:132 (+),score=28.26 TRINITY_DN51506_c0_g3_i1:35-397(+)
MDDGTMVDATMTNGVNANLPALLVITQQRFVMNFDYTRLIKETKRMTFPRTLDMSKYILTTEQTSNEPQTTSDNEASSSTDAQEDDKMKVDGEQATEPDDDGSSPVKRQKNRGRGIDQST